MRQGASHKKVLGAIRNLALEKEETNQFFGS